MAGELFLSYERRRFVPDGCTGHNGRNGKRRLADDIEKRPDLDAGINGECLRSVFLVERLPGNDRAGDGTGFGGPGMVRLVLVVKELDLKGGIIRRQEKGNEPVCEAPGHETRCRAVDSKNGRNCAYCSVVAFFFAYVCVAYP
jgi:hypothetical protein